MHIMPIDLKDRVCVITGAARGIGKAVAEGFAARGAVVVTTDLAPPDCSGAASALAWNVTEPQAAQDVITEVLRRFGRIDAFVANAGIDPRQPWETLDAQQWRQVLETDLDSAWFGAQAAGAAMKLRGYGKIVLVSSIMTVLGGGERPAYVTAKAGLIGLGRSLARAMGHDGIRVNIVMPGAVQTERELQLFPDQGALRRLVDERQCIPGRIIPADIEPTFAFLCSSESDAITGQVVCVDLGWVHY
jgi:3-oxoacyl-[acyl-carrier protein] reductase